MRLLVPAVLALVAAGCSSGAPELAAARELWQAEGAGDYTIDVALRCECPVGTYRVTVRDRQSSVRALDEGNQSAAGALSLTVDDLFDRVHESRGAHRLEVEYDARYGFPRRIEIDRESNVIDDEVVYVVTRYAPLTSGG